MDHRRSFCGDRAASTEPAAPQSGIIARLVNLPLRLCEGVLCRFH
jgi:hypothetical protein